MPNKQIKWGTVPMVLVAVTLFLAACTGEAAQTETAVPNPPITSASPESPAADGETAVPAKLNLNAASGDDYQAAIPDFSNRMVREFLEYRPYISIQQFRQEMGKYVGDDQIAFYEQYVFVPVAVDASDAETLKQLPGVDDAIAAELMNGRPYGNHAAFLSQLADYVFAADLVQAASYLAP